MFQVVDVCESEPCRRARRLKKKCEGLKSAASIKRLQAPLSTAIVSDKHRVIFCYVPKVASSNIRRTLMIMEGVIDKPQPGDISHQELQQNFRKLKSVDSYSSVKADFRFRTYEKVIFVREPIERLISTFNDRFIYTPTEYYENVSLEIINKLGIQVNSPNKYQLKFSNFIRYLILNNETKTQFDIHWRGYSYLCDPCKVQYSFVGKYETIDEDMNLLLKKIGADYINFPKREHFPYYNRTPSASFIETYFRDVPFDDVRQLVKMYFNDMDLFDYKLPTALEQLYGPRVQELVN